MAKGRSRDTGATGEELQLSLDARLFARQPPPAAPQPPVTAELDVKATQSAPSLVTPAPSGAAAAVRAEALTSAPPPLHPEPADEVAPPARAQPRIFGVAELVRAARVALEARFADVRVEGEISGFKRSGPGHFYFCLKDGEAQVDCVMFSREAARVKFRVQDGLLVRCRGRLTIYEGRGKFQLSVTAIEPAGAGALALAFEQLKQKLAAEGLFDPARKRALPFLPRRIGVVTSPTGAVIRDIVRVAHRRFPVPILLSPTAVQGDGAAASIVHALRLVLRAPQVEVIILARGGGSLEDLWAFNDEALARAIAACPVPVISAVGHETDFTVADFVSDVRAPTPSAAAELAVPVAADLLVELQVLGRRLGRAVQGELRGGRLLIERARARLGHPRRLVDERRQALDECAGRGAQALRAALARRRAALRAEEARVYRAHPQRRIADQRTALHGLERRLSAAIAARLSPRRRALESLRAKLQTLSPLGVLERGYSLARRGDGQVITQAQTLAPGEPITVTFRDGEVGAEVQQVRVAEPKR
jgi:exodeoxyribonuclease VII large subunit